MAINILYVLIDALSEELENVLSHGETIIETVLVYPKFSLK